MFAYFALFGYFAAGAVMNAYRAGQKRPHLWIPAIVLVILIGLRWQIGTDWGVYDIMLQLTLSNASHVGLEPSYQLLNWIAATRGWGLWFPNLICAIIFTYGLVIFCREQPNPWLALVVATPYLIIAVAMGFTRQSAAVGLLMVALVQFTKGKYMRVFISLALATTFHISVIAFAPLFAVAIVGRAVVSGILLIVFVFVLYFAFSERIADRMVVYSVYKYSAAGVIPRLVMSTIAAAIFLIWRKRFSNQIIELRIWTLFSLVSFASIALLAFVPSSTIVDRLGIFLVPLQIFVMSRLPFIFHEQKREDIMLVTGIIFYSLAVEVVWLYFGVEAKWYWIPYKNILWDTWFAPA
jgi:hypothetical protein